MPSYNWPKQPDRKVIGKRTTRFDAADKASGAAKYSFDINRPGMLHGKMLLCPHAHARITSIDTSEAERVPGVKGVLVIQAAGSEIRWHGDEIAMVAADTEEHAYDGLRAIKVEYERLPHVVDDNDIEAAGDAAQEGEASVAGDPDKAFADPDVVTIEGDYGIPCITHCCLESHGLVAEWTADDELTVWISTQAVSNIAGQLTGGLTQADNSLKINNVHVICQHIGGGFGSKFSPDRWGVFAGLMAKKTGKPVKMMLDRDHELLSAGSRPSAFAHIKLAAKRDGSLVAWESHHWGTGGPGGGAVSGGVVPYIFTIPNTNRKATTIRTNTGPSRAWRAPNHPQAAALTMTALSDLAAALEMDELEFFKKNAVLTDREDVYLQELDSAAQLIGWRDKWHPRGAKVPGPVQRGLGISMHTWGGRPHNSQCDAVINPDGTVQIKLGSQDLGTGTRTVIAMVAAETFGLKPTDIAVMLGDNIYKPSGASGGSTTVGGVSSSTRRATVNALEELFKKVAPALGVEPDDLEAADGRIRSKSDSSKSLSWKEACAKLGMSPVVAEGRQPGPDQLAAAGVGGVQMADVSVDTETGVVKMNEFVAVQDQGLVINPKTCESQILGAVIMGICWALYEEKIMDPVTGRTLNPDMEFYKLAGLGDIGNIKVHLMLDEKYDSRGVIGNGEPPAISPGAAISNAVANAIGVRVPHLPLTPDRVLAALEKKGA